MQKLQKVAHPTSVNEIYLYKSPTAFEEGVARITATSNFSVFDVGRMEPTFPLDNSTIVLMGGVNFELLHEEGIKTHYLGLEDKNGELVSAMECIARGIAPWSMRVWFLNRIDPKFRDDAWDYSMFKNPTFRHYVLPVECISRNEINKNSSVWDLIEMGILTLQDLGLPSNFQLGDEIPEHLKPLLTYTTKYEPYDRPLTPKQAQELLHLSDTEFAHMNGVTTKCSRIITAYGESRGFRRPDGKIEQSKERVLDRVGTPHEDRLIHVKTEFGISKQRIRDKIRKDNPRWYEDQARAKRRAVDEGKPDFRDLMDKEIELTLPPPAFFRAFNRLTRAGASLWANKKMYRIYDRYQESLNDNVCRAVEAFRKVQ